MSRTQTHKRSRSLQDSPVDISKMRKLTSSLEDLQDELHRIAETEEELAVVMEHVEKLHRILKESKRVTVTFSDATEGDLNGLGVKAGGLVLDASKVAQLVEERKWGDVGDEELKDLRSRLRKIYLRVNMDYEHGARMVLDAILLSLGEFVSILSPNRDLVIIPEMKLEDALFTKDRFQVSFGGSVDYGVIEYEKDPNGENRGRLAGVGANIKYVYQIAAGHIFLVEAKRRLDMRLWQFVPEAVTQAMSIASNAKLDTVRFCLSDGLYFIFFVLERKDEQFTYYESTARELSRPQDHNFDKRLQEIIHLLLEWLKPTRTDLYRLQA